MSLSPLHWVGIAATIGLVVFLGLYSGKRVRNAGDFLVGSRSMGSGLVAGSILGTILGGSSTIGTAELAFQYGLTAWWWTLGSSIGCIILGSIIYRAIRCERISTVGEYIECVFGKRTRFLAGSLLLIAMFMSFIPNVLAAFSIISSFSSFPKWALAGIVMAAVYVYVVVGGVWGTGTVGILKVTLMLSSLIAASWIAWSLTGGPAVILRSFPRYPYFSLFGRGLWPDLSAATGTCLGLISNQVYAQALLSARSDGEARKGALISSMITPWVGLMGIFVGLSMKLIDPAISPSQALPQFILRHMHPLAAGIAIGAFLIAAVGTASGLALGVGTLISSDVMSALSKTGAKARLFAARGSVFGAMIIGVLASCLVRTSFILEWGYIAMGIRAALVTPVFLAAALLGKRMISPFSGVISILSGLAVMLWGYAFHSIPDPVVPSFLVSGATLAIVTIAGGIRGTHNAAGRQKIM